LRPEVQSLIYEMLTEVLPRWRGSRGELLPPQKNPDLSLRELYRELLLHSSDRERWIELINAAHRSGLGVRFRSGQALITGVSEEGIIEFAGRAVTGILRPLFDIRSPRLIEGGLEFTPFSLLAGPPTPPPVQSNMDERLRRLEREAIGAGDPEARLRFLYEQFRSNPWLETWLAWKLEEANQQVLARNAEWSPDCDPCGEVGVDRVRYSLEHSTATRTPHLRVDGLPTKPAYPRQKVRRRYEGARTVVLGRTVQVEGWWGIEDKEPDWLIVVAPYLGKHLTQYGLHIHDVFPDMPKLLPQLLPGGEETTIPWFTSRPDHYMATGEEVRRFIAPTKLAYWTSGPGGLE